MIPYSYSKTTIKEMLQSSHQYLDLFLNSQMQFTNTEDHKPSSSYKLNKHFVRITQITAQDSRQLECQRHPSLDGNAKRNAERSL